MAVEFALAIVAELASPEEARSLKESPMPVGDIRPLKAGMRERYKALRRAMTPQEKHGRITPLPSG